MMNVIPIKNGAIFIAHQAEEESLKVFHAEALVYKVIRYLETDAVVIAQQPALETLPKPIADAVRWIQHLLAQKPSLQEIFDCINK